MQKKQPTGLSRRSFFGAVGGASTVAVAAVMMRPDAAQAYNPGDAETGTRYQENDHVKKFYSVNRYPTAKG